MNWRKVLLIVSVVICCGAIGIWFFYTITKQPDRDSRVELSKIETRDYEQQAIVKVVYWSMMGCQAVVVDAKNHDIIKEGDTIFVHVASPNTKIYSRDGTEFALDWEECNADECKISPESKIEIKFYKLAYENMNEPVIIVEEARELEE